MSKLAKKFMGSVALVLTSVILLTLLVNFKFADRYYLHKKKEELSNLCREVENQNGLNPKDLKELEEQYQAVIVRVEDTSDNVKLNERLRAAFLEKGMGLGKFWLWEKDYESAVEQGGQMRIYNQGHLNYSILVEYKKLGSDFLGVAMIIPNTVPMIRIINWFTASFLTVALLLMLSLLYFLVRKITAPLKALSDMAGELAQGNFKTVQIQTGDEIEALAERFNDMSSGLKKAQEALTEKNRQMERLLSNVSHDLKTPISIIQAYTCGMKDGLDDGTFLDTVIEQNENLSVLVEKLLDLSRIGQRISEPEKFNADELLETVIKEQRAAMEARGIHCRENIVKPSQIFASKDETLILLRNLVTNAVKYADGDQIFIELYPENCGVIFRTANRLHEDSGLDFNQVWEPFYVGEVSRNRYLSGTGLGLAIVKEIAEQQGLLYSCWKENREIYFEIRFKCS